MPGLLKQLIFKPLLRGLLIGGIPFGLVFSTRVGEVVSATTLGYTIILTPVAIGLSSWIAMRGDTLSRRSIFMRALFSALGACVPLPTLVCAVLVFHDLGGEGFSNPKNVPVFAFLFTVWAGVTAFFGSFVALVYFIREKSPKAATTEKLRSLPKSRKISETGQRGAKSHFGF